ncbi:MAG: LysM peptidoglycan-binding domain-containing protein [Gaiellaceae bacterium]
MPLRRRVWLARFGAPAAFLLAVTLGVLLVRSGLQGEENGAPPARAETTAKRTTTTPGTTAPRPSRRFYVVREGDTLGSVAERFRTTVGRLLELNPGIDPTGLQPGQRLRVA